MLGFLHGCFNDRIPSFVVLFLVGMVFAVPVCLGEQKYCAVVEVDLQVCCW
jgi:hypothetical protein